MANFPKHHGIELAGNAFIVNHSVEQLASDPVADVAGRSWYNTTSKTWKMSTLSALGAVEVKTFMTEEAYTAYVTSVASTTAGQGSALVGYSGHTGSNGNFSVAANTTETALDSIIQRIDQDRTDLDSLVTDIVTPLQTEVDLVETSTGLNADGSLPAFAGNYTTGKTTVIAAVNGLDTQSKANADAIVAEASARVAADALKVSKAGDSMTGDLSFGGLKTVTGLREPIADQDAATKIYVDTAVAGIDWKESVRVISKTNVDIATGGLLTIDDVVLADGNRVLLAGQTDASENGVYVASTTSWTRSTDMDGNPSNEVSNGNAVFVEEGTVNGANGYVITTADPIILDTDDITFTQFSGAGQIVAGAGISKSGNELFLNFGAGIAELPNDEIGIETYVAGGLFTTTDGSTLSTDAGATLSINLDADSKMVLSSTGLKLDPAFVSALTNSSTGLQTELDATQVAAGLNADGTLPAFTGTNYLTGNTSLYVSITDLDAQAKVNADAILAEASARTNADSAIVTEVDAVETGAGLNTDGTYTAPTGTNYLGSVTNLKEADVVLDSKAKLNADAIIAETSARTSADSAINTEITATQVGAGLNVDGTYTADATTTYLTDTVSLKNADKKLDTQLAITTTALATLKSDYNASIYRFEATVAQSSYTIVHNLASVNVDVSLWVKDATDGLFHNDIVATTVNDGNTVTFDLTEAKIIRVIIKSFEALV
jgi:hypothetical protein